MKIVFLDRETFPPEANFPSPSFPNNWVNHAYTEPAEVAERVRDAEIIIVNKVVLGEHNLAGASKLKMIALTATGSNNVDLDYCRRRQICVSNIRDYSTQSVVEHTLAVIFALRRDLLTYNDLVRNGAWQQSRQFVLFAKPLADLHGNVLAIVGKGNLGKTLAKYATALGMQVIFCERPAAASVRAGYVEFYEALAQCDILSLHCPLTPANTKMLGEKEFATMKSTALLINTARGALVDEVALAAALSSGEIAGAALDVLATEPPAADNPILRLASEPYLLITPHTAWTSAESLAAGISQTMENIHAFVAGEPLRELT